MTEPEPWLRGPLPGISPLLMPAAHALLQAAEDVERALGDLSTEQIWTRPAGAASVGFHVRHLAGALDRLFTYARGEQLSDAQRAAAATEQHPGEVPPGAQALLTEVRAAVATALDRLRETSEGSLLEPRGVGRQQLPSNVLGLLFHAAEHATRHAGQAVTTARVVRAQA